MALLLEKAISSCLYDDSGKSMMSKDNYKSNESKLIKAIKKILSPIINDESLNNIDVVAFIDILYPLGLSLILAFFVHELSKGLEPDNIFILAMRFLIILLLILYVLFDWDDCHYAAQNNEKNTAFDRILWLTAIFLLSLVTIRFLSSITVEKLMGVLITWLVYIILASRFRDSILEKKIIINGKVVITRITQAVKYRKYKVYRNICIIVWIVMLAIVLTCKYTGLLEYMGGMIDWGSSAISLKDLSNYMNYMFYIIFVASVILGVWLKNKRKKILFIEDDNTHQTDEVEA